MGRKSCRSERRLEILDAFARVLADHGYAGTTLLTVASEAGLSPGLMHHYFENKREMLTELLGTLVKRFSKGVAFRGSQGRVGLEGYLEAVLKLDEHSDRIAAKCWVALMGEALRDPDLLRQIRNHVDGEIDRIRTLTAGKLGAHESSALVAFVLGSLVLGALTTRKIDGFAEPSAKAFANMLIRKDLKTI